VHIETAELYDAPESFIGDQNRLQSLAAPCDSRYGDCTWCGSYWSLVFIFGQSCKGWK